MGVQPAAYRNTESLSALKALRLKPCARVWKYNKSADRAE